MFKALFCATLILLSSASPSHSADSGFSRLFGTIAFQRPMKVFNQWIDVQNRNASKNIFAGAARKLRGGETSSSLLEKAKASSGMQRLRFVNAFWNKYPYITDIKNWGKNDYWAIPMEFLAKSGDCEDYAIVKFYTLCELGIPPASMRIVVLKDTIRKLAHAVLAVEEGGKVYILDNVSNAIVTHERLSHYVPAYSLNKTNAYVHLKGKKL